LVSFFIENDDIYNFSQNKVGICRSIAYDRDYAPLPFLGRVFHHFTSKETLHHHETKSPT
jgi:hypothetical protein